MLLNSTQTGQATSPHHEDHGLRPAVVSTTSRLGHCRPREAVYEAVLV